MIRRPSVVMSVVTSIVILVISTCCVFTGCESRAIVSGDYPGISFYPSDSSEVRELPYFKDHERNTEEYVCVISELQSSGEIRIPSTINDKKVIGVTGGSIEGWRLTIEEGIIFVENCCNDCVSLNTVEIPSTVKRIYNSFKNCSRLENVSITGNIDYVRYAFEGSGSNVDIGCILLLFPGAGLPEDYEQSATVTVAHVTDTLFSYCDSYSLDDVFEQGKNHILEEFPADKEITSEQAVNYKDMINGPLIYTDHNPDCVYTEYIENCVGQPEAKYYDWEPRAGIIDVSQFEYFFPGTVYSENKAKSVMNGDAPLVYCLAEIAGHHEDVYTYKNSNGVDSMPCYHLMYRISIWNYETGDLLAWYYYKSGYAPDRVEDYNEVVSHNTPFFDCFQEKDGSDPTPIMAIENSIFCFAR